MGPGPQSYDKANDSFLSNNVRLPQTVIGKEGKEKVQNYVKHLVIPDLSQKMATLNHSVVKYRPPVRQTKPKTQKPAVNHTTPLIECDTITNTLLGTP